MWPGKSTSAFRSAFLCRRRLLGLDNLMLAPFCTPPLCWMQLAHLHSTASRSCPTSAHHRFVPSSVLVDANSRSSLGFDRGREVGCRRYANCFFSRHNALGQSLCRGQTASTSTNHAATHEGARPAGLGALEAQNNDTTYCHDLQLAYHRQESRGNFWRFASNEKPGPTWPNINKPLIFASSKKVSLEQVQPPDISHWACMRHIIPSQHYTRSWASTSLPRPVDSRSFGGVAWG